MEKLFALVGAPTHPLQPRGHINGARVFSQEGTRPECSLNLWGYYDHKIQVFLPATMHSILRANVFIMLSISCNSFKMKLLLKKGSVSPTSSAP
jgi:hypothetical protein